LPPAQRAARDLAAQPWIPLGDGVRVVVAPLDPREPRQEAIQSPRREELGVGNRAPQRDQVRIRSVLQEFRDDTGDGDRRGSPRGPRDRRRLQKNGGALRHIKARLRLSLQDPAILERPVRLERGRQTDATLPGDLPDRKSTRLNSSHDQISYAVFCLKKK